MVNALFVWRRLLYFAPKCHCAHFDVVNEEEKWTICSEIDVTSSIYVGTGCCRCYSTDFVHIQGHFVDDLRGVYAFGDVSEICIRRTEERLSVQSFQRMSQIVFGFQFHFWYDVKYFGHFWFLDNCFDIFGCHAGCCVLNFDSEHGKDDIHVEFLVLVWHADGLKASTSVFVVRNFGLIYHHLNLNASLVCFSIAAQVKLLPANGKTNFCKWIMRWEFFCNNLLKWKTGLECKHDTLMPKGAGAVSV